MIKNKNIPVHFLILSLLTGLSYSFYAQDSTSAKKIKEPKHFFNTTIFFDHYQKPEVSITPILNENKLPKYYIGKKLSSYSIKQTNLSFYAPLHTVNNFNKDSSVNSNSHFLLTGNFHYLTPHFDSLEDHTLAKLSIGLRYIYNTGKKSIFFVDVCPFVTKDVTYDVTSKMRGSNTFIWSYSPRNDFNFRLGFTKTFLFGNRLNLPYIGFRFGRLDKFNVSMQFPKNMSVNIPINNNLRFSLFTKPQGGFYNYSNRDTLYYAKPEKNIFFGRYEVLTGLRVDARASQMFSFYASAGFSTKNYFAFYSNNFNSNNKVNAFGFFYANNPAGTYFINFGVVLRLGKTKSYYNNRNIYEAIDLNNTISPGDNNTNPGNNNILIQQRNMKKKLTTAEMQDLIDVNELD